MCDGQGIQQLVPKKNQNKDKRRIFTLATYSIIPQPAKLANVFVMCLCELTTTTQFFPLTATEVSPPWWMALKAYFEDRHKEKEEHELSVQFFNKENCPVVVASNFFIYMTDDSVLCYAQLCHVR